MVFFISVWYSTDKNWNIEHIQFLYILKFYLRLRRISYVVTFTHNKKKNYCKTENSLLLLFLVSASKHLEETVKKATKITRKNPTSNHLASIQVISVDLLWQKKNRSATVLGTLVLVHFHLLSFTAEKRWQI